MLGEKEFLRITKPKVIGVNPASQKGSFTKCNSSTSEEQAEVLYPWGDGEGGIPRGRLIETNQIINRHLQNSRLPEKGFQACITPSTYSKSSIGVKMLVKTDRPTDDGANQQPEDTISQRTSIANIKNGC